MAGIVLLVGSVLPFATACVKARSVLKVFRIVYNINNANEAQLHPIGAEYGAAVYHAAR
jgi:hypothetical protein